jgi:hypothetical protein
LVHPYHPTQSDQVLSPNTIDDLPKSIPAVSKYGIHLLVLAVVVFILLVKVNHSHQLSAYIVSQKTVSFHIYQFT